MLSNSVVEEIRRLLAEGKLSQRAISKQIGVSRGTITAISMNRRNERIPRAEEPRDEDLGPPRRCPTCGGTVYMPCRLCRVRDAKFGPGRDRHPPNTLVDRTRAPNSPSEHRAMPNIGPRDVARDLSDDRRREPLDFHGPVRHDGNDYKHEPRDRTSRGSGRW